MSVIMRTQLPLNRQQIETLSNSLGVRQDPPPGMIVHLAYEEGGKLQVLDVWESREQFESFAQGRLAEAMGRFMAENGVQMDGEPSYEFTEVFDVVKGR